MNTRSTSVQHPLEQNGQHNTNPSICNLPSAHYAESLTPTQLTEAHYVALAAEQVRQLDELALIGYAPLDPATRAVYETSLRLAARTVLES